MRDDDRYQDNKRGRDDGRRPGNAPVGEVSVKKLLAAGRDLGDVLSEDADRLGKVFGKGGAAEVTSSQLRRFFGDVKGLAERVRAEPESFVRCRPVIKMLRSKAAYAYRGGGRDGKIPTQFRDFLDKNVQDIDSASDFENFVLFFEAVVGFYYGYGEAKGR